MEKIIGLTYDLKNDWQIAPTDPKDVNAEFDKPETVERVIEAFEKGGHIVRKIGNVKNLLSQMDDLDVDIVFNMCEGSEGRNRESQVPLLLEFFGIPFVGADALTMGITLDKIVAKKLFISAGIPTAKFFEAKSVNDIQLCDGMRFPLMVKTRNEGSSKGINQASRVMDLQSLRNRVSIINTKYKQPALVEEFIRGREFTVPILGNQNPKAMPVIQVSIDGRLDLGDDFYTYERISSDALKYVCPAQVSPGLYERLQEIAIQVYKCVECRDFGRVDFRVDEHGNPYVLEINPLPSLDPKDSFTLFPNALGSNYDEALNLVVNLALERYGLSDESEETYMNNFLQQESIH